MVLPWSKEYWVSKANTHNYKVLITIFPMLYKLVKMEKTKSLLTKSL